jgi:alkanesulfonate monooxygenase SsuD/methylene tetrahydromethanopterin reductase-like flavin-dependent oxidoreductase (luciferase family)
MSTAPDAQALGKVGVWASGLRLSEPPAVSEAAAELEELGYGAAWVPGIMLPNNVAALKPVLSATRELVAATGVVNIWVDEAASVASEFAQVEAEWPGRTLVGIGVSHRPAVGERYRRPLALMRDYLDALDAADPSLPLDYRLTGAIGPKALELARDRARGSHPYLMPPEHTVILESDPELARERARKFLKIYLGLPNYMNNLGRILGLDDADFADGGSDRLVDATVAWGDEEAIRRRINEHLDAGADHVCIQVPVPDYTELPLETWRRLAPALVS